MNKKTQKRKAISDSELQKKCGQIIWEAIEKMQALSGDPGYIGYLTFCTIGSAIAEREGFDKVEAYVEEIRAIQKARL